MEIRDSVMSNISYIYTDIKNVRETLKLTQADMAIFLGVSRLTFIKWENYIETMPLGKYVQLTQEYQRLQSFQPTPTKQEEK